MSIGRISGETGTGTVQYKNSTHRTCTIAKNGNRGLKQKRKSRKGGEPVNKTTEKEKDLKNKDSYQRRMPKVGDRMLVTIAQSSFLERDTWAVVTFVHPRNLWYTVEYMGTHMTETISTVKGSSYLPMDVRYDASRNGYEEEREKRKAKKARAAARAKEDNKNEG